MIFLSYLLYFVTNAITPLQRRHVIAKKNPDPKEQIRFAFEVLGILFLGSFALPFLSPLYFQGSFFRLVALSLVCGVFGMGFFIISYVAQKHVEAGMSNLLVNVYVPVTVALSSVFLGEGLRGMQFLGAGLLFFSMIVISKKHRIGKFKFDKYFLSMMLGGVMLGVLLVAERALQKQTGLSAATMLSWGSQCFFLGLASLVSKSRHTYTAKEVWTTGGVQFMSSLSYVVLLFVAGNLSMVSTITTFKVVIVFVAAAVFLKEREDMPRKMIGSAIAVLGLLLMK